jgi:hypothetical protein
MAGRQRVLVTVKTYPTLSRRYGETVCTAGLREDGTWVRIYPVPFRRLEEAEQYHKYDWLECTLLKNANDPRPESFRPAQASELQAAGHLGTGDNWRERRELLLQRARVYTSLEDLIRGAKENRLSLAVFKPSRILDFRWEAEEREWDPAKVSEMRAKTNQMEIFAQDAWRETFKVIPKMPYSFSYRFEDASGTRSEMQVLDWEAGALYWNCLRATDGDEAAALQKVRQKYLTEFGERDLHFFLGTTQQFHFIAPNPWVIVGVLPIPHQRQLGLL